jgi:hypothetical protein
MDRSFERDLESALGERMCADKAFCVQVWSALANVEWRNDDGREYSCSFRHAGGVIAWIRHDGDYMDWYCSGPYATVAPEIAEKLAGLGWRFNV